MFNETMIMFCKKCSIRRDYKKNDHLQKCEILFSYDASSFIITGVIDRINSIAFGNKYIGKANKF